MRHEEGSLGACFGLLKFLSISRTSKPIHYKTTQEVTAKIHKNGYIMEKTISLPFCNECKN